MKLVLPILLVAAVAIAPTAFAEQGGQGRSPAQFCQNELAVLGAANFRSLYAPGGTGRNAMGKCVSKHARAAAANRTNASRACRAEMAMPEADFRAAHDGKSFAEVYGRNSNDRNAFGKCVSSKTRTLNAQQEARLMNAARACNAERRADSAAFVAQYGGRAASAFGRCVSSKTRRP